MKLKILKYSQKVNLVIKLLSINFVLFAMISCKSQLNIQNKAYYQIVNRIVLQDTIIGQTKKDIWANRLKKKKSTIEQIENHRLRVFDEGCYINLEQNNEYLKTIIEKEITNYRKYKPLVDYFGENKLIRGLENMQKEEILDKSKLDPYIKFVSAKNQHGHLFSSPLIIDGKMLIFHTKFTSEYSSISKLLLYLIDDVHEPKLEEIFY